LSPKVFDQKQIFQSLHKIVSARHIYTNQLILKALFNKFRSFFSFIELLTYYDQLDGAGQADYLRRCGEEERVVNGESRHAKQKKRKRVIEDDDFTSGAEASPSTSNNSSYYSSI
jgi:hypothetical protein